MKEDGACLFRAVGMCHALKFKKIKNFLIRLNIFFKPIKYMVMKKCIRLLVIIVWIILYDLKF